MKNAEMMDLTKICQSFPPMPSPEINRDNYLETIEKIFQDGVQIVVLEGEEGIGRTTLMGKFALRHPLNTFSLYIKPGTRWSSDPTLLKMDFCNQLEWALRQIELGGSENVDDGFLRSRIFELGKRARRERFYFIIDGLFEGEQIDQGLQNQILDWFPIGSSNCHFLISGDLGKLPQSLREKYSCKSFPISPFALHDTATYIQQLGLALESDTVEEIHKVCRGIPGHLAIVRRKILESADVQASITELPKQFSDIFELEWRGVRPNDDSQQLVLAIMAHDRKSHHLTEVAQLLSIEPDAVKTLLQPLRLIDINPETGEVDFVSESFRTFVAQRLRHYKTRVTDLMISDLLRSPQSDRAMTFLPGYLTQAGRYEDLLNYLSPETLERMVEQSQSLIPIKSQAALGVNAARELGRVGALVRFSLHRSVAEELNAAEVLRSEVEAQMKLGNFASAMALAQSAVLTEDRLHLMAIIARIQRENGAPPEPELLEQIRQLYDRIDCAGLGDRAIEIASELIYSYRDLAIELVEKATQDCSTADRSDWAFARLTLAAVDAEQESTTGNIEQVLERIKDPKARRFSVAASVLIGDYSAARVIDEVSKLEDSADQLFLLRQWTLKNRERADAAEVVEFAFRLAIRATEQTITARDFRELATPLPFIPALEKAKQLVGAFDSQKGAIQRLSSSIDYVRLQLLLAETEARYAFESARNRILEVYLYDISKVEDLVIRAECLARLVSALAEMDSQLIPEAEEDLNRAVNELLVASAEHYYAMRGIIRALAKTKPELAQKFAEALNIEARRDRALSDLLKSYIQINPVKLDIPRVERILDSIVSREIRDESLLEILERLQIVDNGDAIQKALPLISRIDGIEDGSQRCKAYCLAYLILRKDESGKYTELSNHLFNGLTSTWEGLDVGWVKVDVGFHIVQSLAEASKELARDFLNRNERYREEIVLDAGLAADAYGGAVRLAIRAFRGLLPRNLVTEQDLEILGRLIDLVPSSGERAVLWADIALSFHVHGQTESCKKIVNEHVKPLWQDVPDTDRAYKNRLLAGVAPALYCANPVIAPEIIRQLPIDARDRAYRGISRFILTKALPFDPYDATGDEYDTTYDLVLELIKTLEQIELDDFIYSMVETIVKSVKSNRNRLVFTQQQKIDIAHRLEALVNAKLPNPRFIKHDGYKIAALAQVASLRQTQSQEWIDLIQRAEQINNLADRALVLGIIAATMPAKQDNRRKETLHKAKEVIRQIPSSLDQAWRYGALAEMLVEIDPLVARECLQIGMEVTVKSKRPELYPMQQRIIDFAYLLDQEGELANTLAAMADDDPARGMARTRLHRHLELLKLKRKIANETRAAIDTGRDADDYAQAAWMVLGSLNAGRIGTVHINETQGFSQVASSLPLARSYPIYSWLIENAAKRYATTPDAANFMRPLFEASVRSAQLVERIVVSSTRRRHRSQRYSITLPDTESSCIEIKAGERERAIAILRDWFEHEVKDYLKIIDEYFGPSDLEALLLLRSVNPRCRVEVLSSRKHHQEVAVPWEETYRNYWRLHISADQDPPDSEIVIVGTKSTGKSPIHDRRWLTKGGGLRIGTSFNSLGMTQRAEISRYSAEEAKEMEDTANRYLVQRRREDDLGEKLIYTSFTL